MKLVRRKYPDAASPPSDLLPALAIIWTPPPEPRVEEPPPAPPVEEEAEEGGTPLYISAKRYGRVEVLPKYLRQLTAGQTRYLKERYLRELDGYEEVEGFDTFFAKRSSLMRGGYGTLYYVCRGPPYSWNRTYRAEVLIREGTGTGEARFKLKPPHEGSKGRRRYGSRYDPILDQFMEGGYEIAEVAVEGKKPGLVRTVLGKRIEVRGLKGRVKVGCRGGVLYLKKLQDPISRGGCLERDE